MTKLLSLLLSFSILFTSVAPSYAQAVQNSRRPASTGTTSNSAFNFTEITSNIERQMNSTANGVTRAVQQLEDLRLMEQYYKLLTEENPQPQEDEARIRTTFNQEYANAVQEAYQRELNNSDSFGKFKKQYEQEVRTAYRKTLKYVTTSDQRAEVKAFEKQLLSQASIQAAYEEVIAAWKKDLLSSKNQEDAYLKAKKQAEDEALAKRDEVINELKDLAKATLKYPKRIVYTKDPLSEVLPVIAMAVPVDPQILTQASAILRKRIEDNVKSCKGSLSENEQKECEQVLRDVIGLSIIGKTDDDAAVIANVLDVGYNGTMAVNVINIVGEALMAMDDVPSAKDRLIGTIITLSNRLKKTSFEVSLSFISVEDWIAGIEEAVKGAHFAEGYLESFYGNELFSDTDKNHANKRSAWTDLGMKLAEAARKDDQWRSAVGSLVDGLVHVSASDKYGVNVATENNPLLVGLLYAGYEVNITSYRHQEINAAGHIKYVDNSAAIAKWNQLIRSMKLGTQSEFLAAQLYMAGSSDLDGYTARYFKNLLYWAFTKNGKTCPQIEMRGELSANDPEVTSHENWAAAKQIGLYIDIIIAVYALSRIGVGIVTGAKSVYRAIKIARAAVQAGRATNTAEALARVTRLARLTVYKTASLKEIIRGSARTAVLGISRSGLSFSEIKLPEVAKVAKAAKAARPLTAEEVGRVIILDGEPCLVPNGTRYVRVGKTLQLVKEEETLAQIAARFKVDVSIVREVKAGESVLAEAVPYGYSTGAGSLGSKGAKPLVTPPAGESAGKAASTAKAAKPEAPRAVPSAKPTVTPTTESDPFKTRSFWKDLKARWYWHITPVNDFFSGMGRMIRTRFGAAVFSMMTSMSYVPQNATALGFAQMSGKVTAMFEPMLAGKEWYAAAGATDFGKGANLGARTASAASKLAEVPTATVRSIAPTTGIPTFAAGSLKEVAFSKQASGLLREVPSYRISFGTPSGMIPPYWTVGAPQLNTNGSTRFNPDLAPTPVLVEEGATEDLSPEAAALKEEYASSKEKVNLHYADAKYASSVGHALNATLYAALRKYVSEYGKVPQLSDPKFQSLLMETLAHELEKAAKTDKFLTEKVQEDVLKIFKDSLDPSKTIAPASMAGDDSLWGRIMRLFRKNPDEANAAKAKLDAKAAQMAGLSLTLPVDVEIAEGVSIPADFVITFNFADEKAKRAFLKRVRKLDSERLVFRTDGALVLRSTSNTERGITGVFFEGGQNTASHLYKLLAAQNLIKLFNEATDEQSILELLKEYRHSLHTILAKKLGSEHKALLEFLAAKESALLVAEQQFKRSGTVQSSFAAIKEVLSGLVAEAAHTPIEIPVFTDDLGQLSQIMTAISEGTSSVGQAITAALKILGIEKGWLSNLPTSVGQFGPATAPIIGGLQSKLGGKHTLYVGQTLSAFGNAISTGSLILGAVSALSPFNTFLGMIAGILVSGIAGNGILKQSNVPLAKERANDPISASAIAADLNSYASVGGIYCYVFIPIVGALTSALFGGTAGLGTMALMFGGSTMLPMLSALLMRASKIKNVTEAATAGKKVGYWSTIWNNLKFGFKSKTLLGMAGRVALYHFAGMAFNSGPGQFFKTVFSSPEKAMVASFLSVYLTVYLGRKIGAKMMKAGKITDKALIGLSSLIALAAGTGSILPGLDIYTRGTLWALAGLGFANLANMEQAIELNRPANVGHKAAVSTMYVLARMSGMATLLMGALADGIEYFGVEQSMASVYALGLPLAALGMASLANWGYIKDEFFGKQLKIWLTKTPPALYYATLRAEVEQAMVKNQTWGTLMAEKEAQELASQVAAGIDSRYKVDLATLESIRISLEDKSGLDLYRLDMARKLLPSLRGAVVGKEPFSYEAFRHELEPLYTQIVMDKALDVDQKIIDEKIDRVLSGIVKKYAVNESTVELIIAKLAHRTALNRNRLSVLDNLYSIQLEKDAAAEIASQLRQASPDVNQEDIIKHIVAKYQEIANARGIKWVAPENATIPAAAN